jgi:hypothetical protein
METLRVFRKEIWWVEWPNTLLQVFWAQSLSKSRIKLLSYRRKEWRINLQLLKTLWHNQSNCRWCKMHLLLLLIKGLKIMITSSRLERPVL